MYNINDICDYLIQKVKYDEDFPLSNLKLQKLLYYVQAWYITFNDKPLFNGKFEAWVHGPVNRIIYDRFKDKKYLYSEITKNDVLNPSFFETVDGEVKNHIDNVLEVYLKYSGLQLEELSHRELPWKNARKGYKELDRCEKEIDESDIKLYYGSLIK
jgi:uncharacterized phage-associated protein